MSSLDEKEEWGRHPWAKAYGAIGVDLSPYECTDFGLFSILCSASQARKHHYELVAHLVEVLRRDNAGSLYTSVYASGQSLTLSAVPGATVEDFDLKLPPRYTYIKDLNPGIFTSLTNAVFDEFNDKIAAAIRSGMSFDKVRRDFTVEELRQGVLNGISREIVGQKVKDIRPASVYEHTVNVTFYGLYLERPVHISGDFLLEVFCEGIVQTITQAVLETRPLLEIRRYLFDFKRGKEDSKIPHPLPSDKSVGQGNELLFSRHLRHTRKKHGKMISVKPPQISTDTKLDKPSRSNHWYMWIAAVLLLLLLVCYLYKSKKTKGVDIRK